MSTTNSGYSDAGTTTAGGGHQTLGDVKAQASDQLGSDYENLKNSFNQLRSDVTKLLGDALGAGRSAAGASKGQAGSYYDSATGAINDKIQGLKDQGSQKVGNVQNQISDNPLTSALIAFGAGFIIAKLFGGR